MLSLQDLSSIFELFGQGIGIGALASSIVWAVAYGIKAFTSWLSSAS
jgi:hypothetical protein